jgi:SAM-dependent methyltransferase
MKDALGKLLLRWRIKTVIPYIQGRLLDIGCGMNDLVKSYSGYSIGVDVFQWGDVDLVVDNTAYLPFGDETFDTVTIIAALNHIPNRREVLIEAYRILRRTGIIIVTMIPPRISHVWHFLRKPWDVDQKERGMKNGEIFGLTPKEVRHLLSKAGFDILFEKSFMLGINHITIGRKNNEVLV